MSKEAPELFNLEKELLQEKCGIVGWFSPVPDYYLPVALTAADGVQHRGQKGAGVALKTQDGLLTHSENGLLREVFTPKRIEELNKASNWVLIHCRYGTYGGYGETNLQPCIAESEGKQLAVVHNGEFVRVENIASNLNENIPEGTSDTYIFTQFLAKTPGKAWEEKICRALSQVQGAYSLIIGVENALFLARDPLGIRPLMIGSDGKGWLAASETHAFDKVGIRVLREVQRGEIIKLDEKGMTTVKRGETSPGNFCDFEWAYFSRPNSLLPVNGNEKQTWMSASIFREQCGRYLAEEYSIPNASFVVGIPDSGVAVATGYAHGSGLPYRQAILRDHYDPNGEHRLFMRDDEPELIGQRVLGKLSFVPDESLWKDAVVVLCDDSIVRGNVSEQVTKVIKGLGAKEVHWVVGFPAITHTCHLGVSMRTTEELIAAQFAGDPQKVAGAIGATSVNYISPENFIRARLGKDPKIPANPKEIFLANGGCGGCVTGIYPINR